MLGTRFRFQMKSLGRERRERGAGKQIVVQPCNVTLDLRRAAR